MPASTFLWDDTKPLLAFDLVLIKGDAGTGMAFTAKKLLNKGFYWFYESDLFNLDNYGTVLIEQINGLMSKKGKICIVCNKSKSHPLINELEKAYTNKVSISFAVHEKIIIPVKEYIIL